MPSARRHCAPALMRRWRGSPAAATRCTTSVANYRQEGYGRCCSEVVAGDDLRPRLLALSRSGCLPAAADWGRLAAPPSPDLYLPRPLLTCSGSSRRACCLSGCLSVWGASAPGASWWAMWPGGQGRGGAGRRMARWAGPWGGRWAGLRCVCSGGGAHPAELPRPPACVPHSTPARRRARSIWLGLLRINAILEREIALIGELRRRQKASALPASSCRAPCARRPRLRPQLPCCRASAAHHPPLALRTPFPMQLGTSTADEDRSLAAEIRLLRSRRTLRTLGLAQDLAGGEQGEFMCGWVELDSSSRAPQGPLLPLALLPLLRALHPMLLPLCLLRCRQWDNGAGGHLLLCTLAPHHYICSPFTIATLVPPDALMAIADLRGSQRGGLLASKALLATAGLASGLLGFYKNWPSIER